MLLSLHLGFYEISFLINIISTHADWLNEERLEHTRTFCLHVHETLSPSD